MVRKAMIDTPRVPQRLRDYDFDLPEALIANAPARERDSSRLLVLAADGGLEHRRFADLGELLRPGDLLVLNNTQVVKARLAAAKDSGGRAELLLERLETGHRALFQARVSKRLKPGRLLTLADGSTIRVIERAGEFYRLEFPRPVLEVLEALGSVPLPPYIKRAAGAEDERRYQTVYGREPGAVAAPTAGLHFTEALLTGLASGGVRIAELTLHVGAGTFQPVRVEDVRQHVMHAERFLLPEETAVAIAETRGRGGRVVAVGTTVVRALESAADDAGGFATGWQETRLLITPGFVFRAVDVLITNFHLPQSTLLMLVCAFGGYARVMAAYASAVREGYRFFSYGDAMLLERDDV